MVGVARGLRQAVAGDAGQREFDGGLETHAVANGDSFTPARVRTTAPMVGTSSSTPRWLAMPKRRGFAMPWPSQRMRSGVIFWPRQGRQHSRQLAECQQPGHVGECRRATDVKDAFRACGKAIPCCPIGLSSKLYFQVKPEYVGRHRHGE